MPESKLFGIEFIWNHFRGTQLFFVIFYLVGCIGIVIPETYSFFLKLIPLALLLSILTLGVFHLAVFNQRSIVVFSVIFVLGFLIEVIGVNTRLVFGTYHYGQSLGLQWYSTPVLIGINWLFLVYATSSVLEGFHISVVYKIVFAAFLMVGYDIVLEKVAPKMDLWQWASGNVPYQNYLAWFVLALFFHSLIKGFRIETKNRLAVTILGCQFFFFLFLCILLD